MPALVAGIHVSGREAKQDVAGRTSPAMTSWVASLSLLLMTGHSSFSPSFLISAAHLPSSRLMFSPYSSGVLGVGSSPASISRFLNVVVRQDGAQVLVEAIDDRRAARPPERSGRNTAPLRSRAGRILRRLAHRAAPPSASAPVTAMARNCPALHLADRRRNRIEAERHMIAHQVGRERRGAFVGDDSRVDAGQRVEQFDCEVIERRRRRGADGKFAGLLLCQRDHVGQRFRRK